MSAAGAKRVGRANRRKLRTTTEADIRRHEVEDGLKAGVDLPAASMVVSPVVVRAKFKMTQAAFARTLQIPLATLRNWEQQRTLPDPAARTLFTLLYRSPSAIKVLTKEGSGAASKRVPMTR